MTKLLIQNVYSIEKVQINFEFSEHGNPKPLIIVGENGSGKTTILSTIADAIYEISNVKYSSEFALHKDHETRAYWRLVGGGSQRLGSNFYLSVIEFLHEELHFNYFHKSGQVEWDDARQTYPNTIEIIISDTNLKGIIGVSDEISEKFTKDQVNLFFPAFRFEYPGWVNPKYDVDDSRTSMDFRKSKSELFAAISAKKNNEWIRNVIDDAVPSFHWLMNKPIIPITIGGLDQIGVPISIIDSNALDLIFAMNRDLSNAFCEPARFFRPKGSPSVSLVFSGKLKSVDMSHLSSGESSLVNIYLSICRNYYQDNTSFILPCDIQGIVIIDEIETHAHSRMQKEMLPELIKIFPKIQFVITTHSALFVLGLNDTLGEDHYSLFDASENFIISSERYKEFESSYSYFKKTKLHEEEIERKIIASEKPLVLFEGKTDVIYIKAALMALGEENILDLIDIDFVGQDQDTRGSKGSGATFLKSIMNSAINNPKLYNRNLLLYFDSDKRQPDYIGAKLRVRTMNSNSLNTTVEDGVENLLLLKDISADIESFYDKKTYKKRNGSRFTEDVLDKNKFAEHFTRKYLDKASYINFAHIIGEIKALLDINEH